MDIATGQPESHPTPLPLDASMSPGVAPPTPIQPGALSGPTYPGLDTTAMFQEQMAAGEADCRAAQATGQDARNQMLSGYQAQALPLGGQIGDDLAIPVVPDQATPPAQSFGYPWAGFYHGNEPLPEG